MNKARQELLDYLRGTRYEVPSTEPTLRQRELKAAMELSAIAALDDRFKRVGKAPNGHTRYRVSGDVNHRMIDGLVKEFGKCPRCQQPRIGECVDIVSGLTGNKLRVHLACVEDGDELE